MKAVCCYCNKSIEGKEIYHIKLINWETKEEPLGGLFCHMNCFDKRMHKTVKKIVESTSCN